MRQIVIAVVVGILVGAAAFVWVRGQEPEVGTTPPASPAEPSAPIAVRPGVFVSATRPGLIVAVTSQGAPAAGVKLELLEDQFDLVRSARRWVGVGAETSDAEGRAQFPSAAGHFLVVATHTGQRAQLEFDVPVSKEPTFVTVSLAPLRIIGGVVSREGGSDPIANAEVRIDLGQRASVTIAKTTTDAFGRFTASVPFAAHYFVRARAPGFVPGSETIPLTTQASIKLERGAVLQGLVLGEDGAPVPDVTVRNAPEPETVVSDREGRFQVTVLAGPHSLHALAPDGRQALQRVTVALGDEVQRVDLKLGSGELLRGRVLAAEKPVANVDVRVLAEPDDLEVASFLTGVDGRFEARGLPKGRYLVRAQRGAGSRALAVGIELPHPPVDLRLSAAGRLTGVVTGPDGAPAERATVRVQWTMGMKEIDRTALTGADGRYEFDDLLPAEVSVQASLDDLMSVEESIYVGPDVTAEAKLTLSPQGRLVGTIEGSDSEYVLIRGQKFSDRAKVTNGRFEALLAPGSYRLFLLTETMFTEVDVAVVRAGELTQVTLRQGDAGKQFKLHTELGSGISFENSPGGVRVDFVMNDCPAAKAGVQLGDLIVSIDGVPTKDAVDAFERLRKPDGAQVVLVLRRQGVDQTVTVR